MSTSANSYLEMAECIVCKARCVVGHDEDGQVHCAACGRSFRPAKIRKIHYADYEKMIKAGTYHQKGGWIAITIK